MPGQIGSGQQSESSSSRRVPQPPRTTVYMANLGNNRAKMAETKALFGWATIDGLRFPYLMREDKKFVAVRMVEMKLLSKYPSTYPDELKNRPPLMSHYIVDEEIKLLNEINREHCVGEYGNYEFSSQDLIVKLQDFEEFYSIVKRHFPDEVLKNLPKKSKIEGGWVQVNNTVVPFVFRNDFRFVPLSVIRYAAQLLVDVDVQGHTPTDDECKYFNNICKTAGLNFKFGKSTKLVMLNMVQTSSTTPVVITELPKDDPFGAAEFKGEEQEVARLPTQIAPESAPAPPASIPPGIPTTMGPGMAGLPPGMVPPNAMMPGYPPSATSYWMNPHMGIFPGYGPASGASPVANLFGMHQKGQVSPHGEVNNNGATKDFPERPSSRGSNHRSTPTSTSRRSSTGTPSPTGQNMYGHPTIRTGGPSAAAGAPPVSMGMPPPGLLTSQGLLAGNRMMFPLMTNQSPSDYQKLLQMVQMQSMKSQGAKGPPPLVPADPYSSSRRLSTEAPPNVTVSRTSSIPRQGSRPRGRPPIISADEPKVKPQHSSRPITTAMANEQQPQQLNPRVPIKRLDFEGKSMACLVKERSCFALMEALSRVFFPYVPMDEFRYAVEMVLNVPVLTLTDEEEHAFIQFYGLPTSKLKCKKAIKLVDFSQYLPQLKYMYKEKADAAGFTGINGSSPKGASLPPNFLPPRFNNATSENNIRGMKSSPPKSHTVASGTASIAASNALKNMMDNKKKRAAEPTPAHTAPPNKKAKKRLDDMVNRLWSKNQSSSSTTSATEPRRGNSESDNLSEPSVSPAAPTPPPTAVEEEPMDQSTEDIDEPLVETDHEKCEPSGDLSVPVEQMDNPEASVTSPKEEDMESCVDAVVSEDCGNVPPQTLENQVTEHQQITEDGPKAVNTEASLAGEEQTDIVTKHDVNADADEGNETIYEDIAKKSSEPENGNENDAKLNSKSETTNEVANESNETEISNEVTNESNEPETSNEVAIESNEPETSNEVTNISNKAETTNEVPNVSNEPETSNEVTNESNEPETTNEVANVSNEPELANENANVSNEPENTNEFPNVSNEPKTTSEVANVSNESETTNEVVTNTTNDHVKEPNEDGQIDEEEYSSAKEIMDISNTKEASEPEEEDMAEELSNDHKITTDDVEVTKEADVANTELVAFVPTEVNVQNNTSHAAESAVNPNDADAIAKNDNNDQCTSSKGEDLSSQVNMAAESQEVTKETLVPEGMENQKGAESTAINDTVSDEKEESSEEAIEPADESQELKIAAEENPAEAETVGNNGDEGMEKIEDVTAMIPAETLAAEEVETKNTDIDSEKEPINVKGGKVEEMVTDSVDCAETDTSEDVVNVLEEVSPLAEITTTGSGSESMSGAETENTGHTESKEIIPNVETMDAETTDVSDEPEQTVTHPAETGKEDIKEAETVNLLEPVPVLETCELEEEVTVSQDENISVVSDTKDTNECDSKENAVATETGEESEVNVEDENNKQTSREEKTVQYEKRDESSETKSAENQGFDEVSEEATKDSVILDDPVKVLGKEAVEVEGKVTVTEITPHADTDVKSAEETKELSDTNKAASD